MLVIIWICSNNELYIPWRMYFDYIHMCRYEASTAKKILSCWVFENLHSQKKFVAVEVWKSPQPKIFFGCGNLKSQNGCGIGTDSTFAIFPSGHNLTFFDILSYVIVQVNVVRIYMPWEFRTVCNLVRHWTFYSYNSEIIIIKCHWM